ncbi:DNA repair protein [Actinidia chinensis var. chinensis]|uniref:DNA repair protein n=1 Tax=Actinidia chinensis var. chinensis TaxID=1590841 RepID=A0A2R6P9A5_ACTCC|nr:DNA repair protein [Actinidia chinensis var. chinensis]
MGVHGLWELLAPVGRRVSVETLAGKKLAIDASIWMVQFMKAMRDERGEMVRNAHLLGFFRRICKLLFLRTKPVFVFDGGTPALKRRTVIARRRQRENAQAKIRKTAEKLLLNHLKEMRLKELADDLKRQSQNNGAKGKKVISDQIEMADNNAEGRNTVPFNCNQEELDEMLAASLAAEEDGIFVGSASTSGVGILSEEEDGDEDEEMVLPAMNGKVDPAALAALPPSMQLDLLVQMRERLMAENRQKYQKVKKAPAKFSELQIQAYLKTVAFRREIDEVQKSAAGKGVGGVQTSRIASEANREFIFSTSFTGDKDVLTSAGVERQGEKLDQTPSESAPSVPLDSIASTKKSNAETGSIADDPERVFDGDIQTYLDERGHVRVSRVRAMGIRMTRDLQRNLDLMKEIEQDIVHTHEIANKESLLDKNAGDVSRSLPDKVNVKETSCHGSGGSVHLDDRNDQSTSKNPNLMEISFEDDCGHKCLDVEDDLFARLVAGDPVMISSGDNSPSKKHSFESDSDCDWEEGVIEEKGDGSTHDVRKESRLSFAEGGSNYDREVEWEDGDSDVLKYASTSLAEPRKFSSKGALEEEALFQEAIRRSLEDLTGQQSSDAPFADDKSKKARNMAGEIAGAGSVCQESDNTGSNLPMENVVQIEKSSYGVVSGVESLDVEARMNKLNTDISLGQQFAPSMSVNTHNSMGGLREKPFARDPTYHVELMQQDTSEGNVLGEIGHKKSIARVEEKGVYLSVEKLASNVSSRVSTYATTCSGVNSQISDMVSEETPCVILADAQLNAFEAAENRHVLETIEHGDSSVKESTNHDVVQKMSEEQKGDEMAEQRGSLLEKFTSKDDHEQPTEVAEASLEEELLNLSKERIDLADEQRKLERNAESVSGEMFAECQELLQMFGLPYIIAPMEAEAQCAYMELANLVDGVVTDDSDVFLFGAKSVYKNIFDERKYVETYFMKDIENELGQTREKLIRMALLLGSDYTEGVSGIGIVNAVEVVNAFPEEEGLRKFREWIESPDPTILGKFDVKTGSSSRKRGSKVSDNDVSCSNSTMEGLAASDQTVLQTMDDIQKTKQIFVDKHRNVSKNWHIPSAFPNEAVISAYASPQVDNSTEPFSWGKPDLFVLRKLCWEKFGWSTQKADELLLPVLKEYNKHETQLRLEAFYSFNERFAKIRSKRIKKAVKGITGKKSFELMDDSVQDASKSRKKRRVSPSDSREDKLVDSSSGVKDCVTKDESNSVQRSTAKQTRTMERAEPVPSEARNPEPLVQRAGRRNTNQNLSPRGRDRRSERGRAVGRGRRKKKPCHANAKNSSDEGSSSNYEQEMQVEKLEGTHGVRKSTRIRKSVKYNLDDLEMDEPGKADQDEENSSDKEAVQEEPSADHSLLGEKTQQKAGDPSFEEHSGEDYLEMGGGFCMGEAEPELETDQTTLGQNCDPSFEAELCKQYLNMGGGFCLDEGGTSKDPGTCCSNPARPSLSADADPAHSDFAVEADPDIGSVQLVSSPTIAVEGSIGDYRSGLGTSPPDSTRKDDSGTEPVNSLLAMPNLRRKRRKS